MQLLEADGFTPERFTKYINSVGKKKTFPQAEQLARPRPAPLPVADAAADAGAGDSGEEEAVGEPPAEVAAAAAKPARRPERGDSAWIYLMPPSGGQVGGDAMLPKDVTRSQDGENEIAFWPQTGLKGGVVVAQRLSPGSAVRLAEEYRELIKEEPEEDGGATPRAGAPKKNEEVEGDIRVLPVAFDHGERWRTLENCSGLYDEVEFEDFPLSGPRTLGRDVRQLRKQNSNFVRQHEEWRRRSGVRNADRSVHEHLALSRGLHLLMCYDQVQICNLAGAEALNRRRVLIEVAHAGHPDTPSYEGAEEYLGHKESAYGTVADPALTAYVAGK